MKKTYIASKFEKEAFNCPNCGAFSNHDWTYCYVNETYGRFNGVVHNSQDEIINKLYLCKCQCCGYISFWYNKKLIWPLNSCVELPSVDMPEDIKKLYNEASSIVDLSPKGSCAILRLALQKLCNRLAGQPEKSKIDGSIKKLVERGLPDSLQKMMDIVRIVGDEAVHPGEINIDDNKDLAIAMFRLINLIIEKIVTEPKEINELYNLMPEEKLNRDKNKKDDK